MPHGFIPARCLHANHRTQSWIEACPLLSFRDWAKRAELLKGPAMRLPRSIAAVFFLLTASSFAMAESAAVKIFHGVGKVVAVNAEGGFVQINHEAIAGLMDAMEMEFPVKPAALLRDVKKGDRVEFDVQGDYVIIGLHKRD